MSFLRRAFGLTRWVRRPLTVSQALASIAGVGALVLAASAMEPREFAQFALFNLAYNLLTGLVRAGLYTPSLIARRKMPTANVPARYVVLAGLGTSAAMLGTIWALGVRDPADLALVAGSAAVPAWFDWLSNRAVSLDRRWDAASANLLRVLTVAAAAFSPELRSDSVSLQAYLALSLLVPIAFLLWRLPRVRAWVPYRAYARPAAWQLLDFVLGQSLNTVPLLVLGGAAAPGPVAGVRFAQSLLGPLNLTFAAASANLVADGATRAEYAAARSVIARGTRIGRILNVLSLGLVGLLTTTVWLTGFGLKGVDNASLLLGLVLVGISLTTTGWANVHAVVLRILDQQARVTFGRGLIFVLTTAGFGVGFLAAGTTGSLVGGFCTLTVASPLVFLPMASRAYHKLH